MTTLTLGVPTFNRRDAVLDLVEGYLTSPTRNPVHLLVIDDGSDDGTEAALQARTRGHPRVRILVHERNLGYARTYTELLEQCSTEYLVVAADDDELLEGQLDALVDALARSRPDLLASQWSQRDGRMVRGSAEARTIAPRELFQAAHHAPGLAYRVAACSPGVAKLERLVTQASQCALVWPQVVVVAHLLASGDCWWWPEPVLREGPAPGPSGIFPTLAVAGAWETVRSLDEHLASELRNPLTASERDALEAMRDLNANRVYAALRRGMLRESPFLAQHFDRVARRHALRLYLKGVREWGVSVVQRTSRGASRVRARSGSDATR